eukprot:Rmarinus@m.21514
MIFSRKTDLSNPFPSQSNRDSVDAVLQTVPIRGRILLSTEDGRVREAKLVNRVLGGSSPSIFVAPFESPEAPQRAGKSEKVELSCVAAIANVHVVCLISFIRGGKCFTHEAVLSHGVTPEALRAHVHSLFVHHLHQYLLKAVLSVENLSGGEFGSACFEKIQFEGKEEVVVSKDEFIRTIVAQEKERMSQMSSKYDVYNYGPHVIAIAFRCSPQDSYTSCSYEPSDAHTLHNLLNDATDSTPECNKKLMEALKKRKLPPEVQVLPKWGVSYEGSSGPRDPYDPSELRSLHYPELQSAYTELSGSTLGMGVEIEHLQSELKALKGEQRGLENMIEKMLLGADADPVDSD